MTLTHAYKHVKWLRSLLKEMGFGYMVEKPKRRSFIVFIHTLFASLTGLPALLAGAAPVSRVWQVFGLGRTLPFPPSLGFCKCLSKSSQPPRPHLDLNPK